MKILIIHNRYNLYGGEDTVFDNEVQLLRENGNEVKVVIFENKDANNFTERIGLAINSIFSFRSFFRVKKKLNQFQPDVVHVHNIFYTASPSVVWAAKFKKIPVVMTLHNFRLICPGALLFRNGVICEKCRNKLIPYIGVIKKCFKKSFSASLVLTLTLGIHKIIGTWRYCIDTFITLTPFAAEIFEKSSLRMKKKQIQIKPNWTFPISLNCSERTDTFLYVGRLSVEKGIPFLLETFRKNGLSLQIIGDGPLREEIQKVRASNIDWIGSRNRDQVLKIMSESKAIVFCSCWYEMFPMVVIEALATGTPVIAPNLGGIPHIVLHKKTGLLYTPNNIQAFSEQIDTLRSNQTLYNNLNKYCYQEYLEKYSPEKAYRKLISIYEKVLVKTKIM
jgi:glycosyltransferase involved in cell wall biosynthesis